MARKGQAGQALTVSLVASVIGGLVGAVLLSVLAPVLAEFALAFGPAEYFALGVLALTIIGSLGEGSLSKGFISAGIGVLIAMVGLDPISGFKPLRLWKCGAERRHSAHPVAGRPLWRRGSAVSDRTPR